MQIAIFKQILEDVLLKRGFQKKNNQFYFSEDGEIVCVIGVQKSAYSNSYYVNLAFVVKKLHPESSYPKEIEGDIRIRFFGPNHKSDVFYLDEIGGGNIDELRHCFEENVSEQVVGFANIEGVKKLLEQQPILLNLTRVAARKLFGYS